MIQWDKSFLVGFILGIVSSLILVTLILASVLVTMFTMRQMAAPAAQKFLEITPSPSAPPAAGADHVRDPSKPMPPPPAAPTPAPKLMVTFDDLEGRPSIGPKDAPVTLVEFSDFHCPFCQRLGPTLEQVMRNFPGKVRRVWRHFPLSMHQGAFHTHEASECANEQNKFWEYHDKLFETQGGLRDDASLIRLAKQAGLNKKKFEKCLAGGKYRDLIQQDIAKAEKSGVQGTPAVFVNGELVVGAQPYENFERILKAKLPS